MIVSDHRLEGFIKSLFHQHELSGQAETFLSFTSWTWVYSFHKGRDWGTQISWCTLERLSCLNKHHSTGAAAWRRSSEHLSRAWGSAAHLSGPKMNLARRRVQIEGLKITWRSMITDGFSAAADLHLLLSFLLKTCPPWYEEFFSCHAHF